MKELGYLREAGQREVDAPPIRTTTDLAPALRLMRPTERGAVRNLGAPLFEHLGGYREALDRWLRHPSVVTVVAPGSPGPVGFALIGCLHAGPEPEAYLLAIGVAPSHRGRGLGRALLHEAVEQARRRARRWQVRCLRLDVHQENAAARALFTAAGFVPLGPGQPYARGQVSLRMERPLEGADTR